MKNDFFPDLSCFIGSSATKQSPLGGCWLHGSVEHLHLGLFAFLEMLSGFMRETVSTFFKVNKQLLGI